jgi:hypothetical protein
MNCAFGVLAVLAHRLHVTETNVSQKRCSEKRGLTKMNAGSYVLLPLPAGPITSWAWRIGKAGQLTYDDSGQMKKTTEALIARL